MSRMMPTGSTGLSSRTTATGRARWRRAWPDSPPAHLRRRRLLRVGLAIAAILAAIAAAQAVARRLAETPKVEPPFEQIVNDRAGPIRDFALADTAGARHTICEWAGRPAIVLFFLATECPASNGYAPEMARLARQYGPRGVLFWAIHSDPETTPEQAASHAAQYGLDLPVLLDPEATVARQAGVRVTPEAMVVAPDGQVFYRGRLDDLYAPTDAAGRSRPRTTSRPLSRPCWPMKRPRSPRPGRLAAHSSCRPMADTTASRSRSRLPSTWHRSSGNTARHATGPGRFALFALELSRRGPAR